MTSRESLRPQQGQQVPKTPATGVSRTVTGGIEKYDGAREPIKVRFFFSFLGSEEEES